MARAARLPVDSLCKDNRQRPWKLDRLLFQRHLSETKLLAKHTKPHLDWLHRDWPRKDSPHKDSPHKGWPRTHWAGKDWAGKDWAGKDWVGKD